jgi:hypothetical protein
VRAGKYWGRSPYPLSPNRSLGWLVAKGLRRAEEQSSPSEREVRRVTAKGVQAYDCALQTQAPSVNMLGEGFDPRSIEEAGRVLGHCDTGLSVPRPTAPTKAGTAMSARHRKGKARGDERQQLHRLQVQARGMSSGSEAV